MVKARYFREELSFLREQGVEFSRTFPQLSQFLDAKNTDPDVERLLEGFAFLTARLREKIDDEFPELTHSVINMLWPNYLRPLPSMVIMQFLPDEHASITEKQVIKAGTHTQALESVDGTLVQFQNCRDIALYPIKKDSIKASHSRDSSILNFNSELLVEHPIEDIKLDTLRFFIHGDGFSTQMIYFWFNQFLESVEVEYFDEHRNLQSCQVLPTRCVKKVGFKTEDAILPYPANAYEGYRILQEYLVYPQGFHFFDLTGLSQLTSKTFAKYVNFKFTFSATLPADVSINQQTLQLFCSPAINLFKHDADPIDLNGRATEYALRPTARNRSHYEIFSVDKVQGWLESSEGRSRGASRVYSPFESFQHEIERSKHREALYYRARVKDSIYADGFDHSISFIRSDESFNHGMSEAISIELTCTNRSLPMQLGIGDICEKTDTSPAFAVFNNITQPTEPLRPAIDGSLLWTLISNLSLNYLSLLSKDALSSILRAYDFRALSDRQAERTAQLRLNGIKDINTKPTEKLIRGLPVRGIQSEVTLDEQCFNSEGDLYLFGTVLSHFFSLYASINSFHQLVVINSQNKEVYSWDTQMGQQPLL